jgi:hypothetical protein
MRQYIRILFAVFFVVLVSGCLNKPITVMPTEQGVILRNAINAKDFAFLADFIMLPLLVREQEWETADDGYGYVLGAKNTLVANNPEDLNDAFRMLEHVEMLGETSLDQEFTITDFESEFAGVERHWKSLSLVVFFRGQGDAEHIVVLGLDKKSKKLSAIYFN